MHVLLIGPRGSGKSSVGQWLADHLHRPFVDLDDRALACFDQATVSGVWSAHGEHSWRDAERAELEKALAEKQSAIIALGGGTPIIPAARAMIEDAQSRDRAFVIYLRTSPDRLRQRLTQSPGDRPPLTGGDSIEEIERVLETREPIYDALADCTCDTDECTTAEIGTVILSELKYNKA